MAASPILITRSVKVFETKKSKQLVSTTFIAKFSDGAEKFLNEKKWQELGLLKPSDLVDQPLSVDECCLYFKDWSKNPTFGTTKKSYPPSTLPTEMLSLIANC